MRTSILAWVCLLLSTGAHAAISDAYPEVVEWGLADPRPPSISRKDRPPPMTDMRARELAIQSLFADPGVDVYDVRIDREDGRTLVRSVSGGDPDRARHVIQEIAAQNRILPARCYPPRGAARNAATILDCVRIRIASESGAFVDQLKVEWDEKRGRAILLGRAYHLEAKRLAGRAARVVPGVLQVENRLDAKPAVPRQDSRMLEELRQRISIREDLPKGGFEVLIEDGVARLIGSVATERERVLLRSLAEQVRGVLEVRDELLCRACGS